jgi:5-methylcytosine-specific restriction endonuclease McrA
MSKKNGLPCKKCGTNEWYDGGGCKQCGREQTVNWKRNNQSKLKEQGRRYYQRNRKKWHERSTEWRRNNPEKHREYVANWQRSNPEKHAERVYKWQRDNPEKANAIIHRRRTRKTEAGGSYTAYEWKELVKQQNGRCLACGKKAKLTADHVIPVVAGGTSDISNIQGLCGPCNSSKGAKTIDYRKEGGILRWIQEGLL